MFQAKEFACCINSFDMIYGCGDAFASLHVANWFEMPLPSGSWQPRKTQKIPGVMLNYAGYV